MKKVIFGIMLTIVGLVGASVLFMSVFLVRPTFDWYEVMGGYQLSGLFILCIIDIIIGMLICGIAALLELIKSIKLYNSKI